MSPVAPGDLSAWKSEKEGPCVELELSDDQQLFRETTRRFLESSVPLPVVRELGRDSTDGFVRSWWRQGAELGWTSMLVPEAEGGGSVSGQGLLDLILIAEEMGRLVSPGPLIACNVVAAALGAPEAGDHGDVLRGLLDGDVVATWAMAEPDDRWSADDVALTATPDAGAFVLTGIKAAVEAAGVASHFLVSARNGRGDGLTQFLVPADAPGLTVHPRQSLDLVRRFGEVSFDGVPVAATAAVGRIGAASVAIERQLQCAVVMQCAEMVGAMDRVFEFTVEYAFDRFSFARPLASYQALKHRFADMKLWLESSHATLGGAAHAVQAQAPNAGELVDVAKSYIADHATALMQDCVQMHGGIGVTWEHDLHLYLRRVAQDSSLYGTAADHRERIAISIGL
jgi:alkylation response protein AidB-like acyl-CoA dehydrogenase